MNARSVLSHYFYTTHIYFLEYGDLVNMTATRYVILLIVEPG